MVTRMNLESSSHLQVLFNRGNASFQLGCHRDALADYAEAIRLEPENATYLHHKVGRSDSPNTRCPVLVSTTCCMAMYGHRLSGNLQSQNVVTGATSLTGSGSEAICFPAQLFSFQII